jgi:hypothetical protein
MGLAQGALRSLAVLEPTLVMPELLERAYSGLEVVNETHRTTAVLSMLAGVSLPLSSEKIWLGGQKHILPLLEMCIPGIDLVSDRAVNSIISPHVYLHPEERPNEDHLCDIFHNCRCSEHQDRGPLFYSVRIIVLK